jgi:hypothetical protein
VNPLGQVHHFLEKAVQPVTDQHALLHRLHVDIARLGFDGTLHHQVDEIDDGRRFAALLEPGNRLEDIFVRAADQCRVGVCQVGGSSAAAHGPLGAREIGPGLVGARKRFIGVAALDGLDDVAACGDHLLDSVPGLELQVLHEAEKERIRHRDRQQVLLEADRHAHTFERNFLRYQDDRDRIGRVFSQVDVRKPQLQGKCLRNLFFRRQIHPDEDDAEPFARALVLPERSLEVVVRDEPGLNQAFSDLLAHSPLLRNGIESLSARRAADDYHGVRTCHSCISASARSRNSTQPETVARLRRPAQVSV